jgi:hypothetical protein
MLTGAILLAAVLFESRVDRDFQLQGSSHWEGRGRHVPR